MLVLPPLPDSPLPWRGGRRRPEGCRVGYLVLPPTPEMYLPLRGGRRRKVGWGVG